MNRPKLKIEPWSYSEQKGVPGHCIMAQVFQGDEDGTSICAIQPENNPEIATNTARAISAVPEMIDALMNLENDDGSIPDYVWEMRNNALKKAGAL